MDQINSNTTTAERKKGAHLTLDERGMIQALKGEGYSLRSIAKRVGCSPNTVRNELKRGTPTKTSTKGRPFIYKASRGQDTYKGNL